MVKMRNPLLLYPYSPTAKPFPPLAIEDACECPRVVVNFSRAYLPYILGALELYRWEDAFTGTTDQKLHTVGLFADLMGVFAMARTDCGCDSGIVWIYRINPVNGQIERSQDNGDTWEPEPNDPQNLATRLPPLPGADGEVKRCEAANNVITQLKAIQDRWGDWIGTLASIIEFEQALIREVLRLLLTPLGGEVGADIIDRTVGKIFEVANHLYVLTEAEYDAWFTEQLWQDALCIVLCETQANGTYTDAGWASIKSRFEHELNFPPAQAGISLKCMVDVLGSVGLNNAATLKGGGTIPCDECECTDCAIAINFDDVGEDYTIVDGQLQGFGWEGSLGVAGEVIGGDVYSLVVEIPTNPDCVQFSTFFRYKASNSRPIQDIGLTFTYYDALGNVLRDSGTASGAGLADNTWREAIDSPPNLTGVSKIRLLINWGGHSQYGGEAILDEVQIN